MKPMTPASLPSTAPRLRRLRALGRLLDDSIPIPGTDRRIGIDPLLGLIPGVGDGAGAMLSTYIIIEAARFGVPRAILLRMAANVGLEALVGVVPLLGDLFDAGWKANLRNLELLQTHLAGSGAAERHSRRFVAAFAAGIVLLLLGVAALSVWLGIVLFGALMGM